MTTKTILNPERLRRIDAGFSFIPHRFLTDGFLESLSQKALLLNLFLILVSDRHGRSFYAYGAIVSIRPAAPKDKSPGVLSCPEKWSKSTSITPIEPSVNPSLGGCPRIHCYKKIGI
ncbi:MAG: hypothetical protein ABIN18_22760 [Pseudomonadota bacterium]